MSLLLHTNTYFFTYTYIKSAAESVEPISHDLVLNAMALSYALCTVYTYMYSIHVFYMNIIEA